MLKSLLNKFADLNPATFLKRDSNTDTQMFRCEYCEISNNNYFQEDLRMAASKVT